MVLHFYRGESGSLSNGSDGEDGVNYLRRLKGDVAKDSPADATATSRERAPAGEPAIDWKERRQSPRLRCSGSVEFRTEGSNVRMWGTLTDISLHGCYVEMNTTFPVDTKVELVLKSFGIGIRATGTVRATYASSAWGSALTTSNQFSNCN